MKELKNLSVLSLHLDKPLLIPGQECTETSLQLELEMLFLSFCNSSLLQLLLFFSMTSCPRAMVLEVQAQVFSSLSIWQKQSYGIVSPHCHSRIKLALKNLKEPLQNCFMVLSSDKIDLELFKVPFLDKISQISAIYWVLC